MEHSKKLVDGVGHSQMLDDRITRIKSFQIVNLQMIDVYDTYQKILMKKAQQVSDTVVTAELIILMPSINLICYLNSQHIS